MSEQPVVRTGLERLAADGFAALRGQRVGVIANPTSVLPDLRHAVDALADGDAVDLVAVFGPEHGFRGVSQAGHGEGRRLDPATGVPVYDAYNDTDRLAELFDEAGVDTVVFDIQDIGVRFYTYIWTMYLAMAAAAAGGKRFVVADRPNPLGGAVAGPVLDEAYATLVGLKPIPVRHGMTIGELAGLFNAEFLPRPAELTVLDMRGWRRDLPFADTGLPWIAPSPNMPTVDTALVYPGTGLFEATELSEGRGTTQPFQLIGAPGIDRRWTGALTERELPGVRFREAYFTPMFAKWSGRTCGGIEVRVTDASVFEPIRTALTMIVTARRLYPRFGWREDAGPAGRFELAPPGDDDHGDQRYWIDKLTGSAAVRAAIDGGADADEIIAGWQPGLDAFGRIRERYLRYPG